MDGSNNVTPTDPTSQQNFGSPPYTLSLQGDYSKSDNIVLNYNRWDLPQPYHIESGLGISIRVDFSGTTSYPGTTNFIDFHAVGADFQISS